MIFGRNLGRRYSGSATPDVLHDLIGRCLSPDMSLGAGGEPLEAIIVIKQSEAVKVLPVYGIDSLWSSETRQIYQKLKEFYGEQLSVEVHIVHRPTMIVDDVFSYEKFLEHYASVEMR